MNNRGQLYEKLYNFLGIIDKWCWHGEVKSPMGTYRIRWMPQLRDGWRRLTYEEFCTMYPARETYRKWVDDERTDMALAYLDRNC